MTNVEAFEAAKAHHASLEAGVSQRMKSVLRAVNAKSSWEAQAGEFVAYFADEVMPHAQAEEKALYPLAVAQANLGEFVSEMVEEHRYLATRLDALALADSGVNALAVTSEIYTLFATHVQKENEILLPELVGRTDVNLSEALEGMHQHLSSANSEHVRDGGSSALEDSLLRLVLEAAEELSYANQSEWACRLAAHSWQVVRAERPDLARQVTKKLHSLSRSATTVPVGLTRAPVEDVVDDVVLDVRSLPPAGRHETIFAAFAVLRVDSAFILVNDHDPKPLYYQLQAEHAGEFTWDYLESLPREWRVRIGRVAHA